MSERAGILYIKTNGIQRDAKGSFTYNLGREKRDPIIGQDHVHGYKTSVQVAFIEGAITDSGDLTLDDILLAKDSTVTLELANGKVIVLSHAWYGQEGTVNCDESEIPVRFECDGANAEEI